MLLLMNLAELDSDQGLLRVSGLAMWPET
jgi:hypothetical protein